MDIVVVVDVDFVVDVVVFVVADLCIVVVVVLVLVQNACSCPNAVSRSAADANMSRQENAGVPAPARNS